MREDDTITIRRAASGDRSALDRLAGRDSRLLPDDEFLIAEVAGEPWAAIGLRTDTLVADPFHPSAEVAEFLRVRADRARGEAVMHRSPPPWLRWHARRAAT